MVSVQGVGGEDGEEEEVLGGVVLVGMTWAFFGVILGTYEGAESCDYGSWFERHRE